MTHTPGKWELRADGVFMRVVHGDHKITVAANIVSEANARLIAAAPDLLQRLEMAAARIEDMLREDDGQAFKEARKALPAFRAVIARARGESA